ncbi:MAG: hypothetical protein H7Y20_16670 [Bryobacteraceae bacterium]|nr:hypothetical protein [Bryobacteraceae bacterium]
MLRARFLLVLCAAPLYADKIEPEQRLQILRGITAEYATAKVYLPRSKKPLEFKSDGTWDKGQWAEAGQTLGPAARAGDLVQITHVGIDKNRIVLEINGGMKGGRKWYDNVQVGMGGGTTPVRRNQTSAPGGTSISLIFDKDAPAPETADIKKMLAPVLDFERRTATEQVVDTLPPEVQAAVRENRAIEGMDRDQVLLSLGKPRTKVRESKDGMDSEDWIYGLPPGKVTFITFTNGKVIRIKDSWAGLGGQTMPSMKPPI